MARVNISLSIDNEQLISEVIEPFRRDKRLSHLIETLLKGYWENPEIRAYVEGDYESEEAQALENLRDITAQMRQSAETMGMYASIGSERASSGVEDVSTELQDDVFSLKEEVKKTSADLSEIKGLLTQILGGAVPITLEKAQESLPQEEALEEEAESFVSALREEDNGEANGEETKLPAVIREIPSEELPEQELNTDNILNSLLENNEFSF